MTFSSPFPRPALLIRVHSQSLLSGSIQELRDGVVLLQTANIQLIYIFLGLSKPIRVEQSLFHRQIPYKS